MKAIINLLRYIYQNNAWYEFPFRVCQAIWYQCQKRLLRKICVKTLFNGTKIFLFPGNPVCSSFVYTKIPDKQEIIALRSLCDNNTIFLDVGANVGAYSLLLLDKVKTVYAFEAHPTTAKYCKMNFLLNQLNETQVLEVAVSDNNEDKFFSNKAQGCPTNQVVSSQNNSIKVAAISLDQFIQLQNFKPLSFIIKIDVEGYEAEVFKGAQILLRDYFVKGIIFEKFSSKNNEIIKMLGEFGFEVKPIGNNNMLAVKAL
ncbi:MAG: FkbM family methyltransferase [Proteobacteria bacterium]|nr:FkbM family methyltransferase [Pseudomonadota bacterium]